MAIRLSKIAARCRAAIVVVARLFIGWRVRWRREERACGPAGAPQSLHRQISLHFSLKASISSVCVPSNTPLSLSLSSSTPPDFTASLIFSCQYSQRRTISPGSLLRSCSTQIGSEFRVGRFEQLLIFLAVCKLQHETT